MHVSARHLQSCIPTAHKPHRRLLTRSTRHTVLQGLQAFTCIRLHQQYNPQGRYLVQVIRSRAMHISQHLTSTPAQYPRRKMVYRWCNAEAGMLMFVCHHAIDSTTMYSRSLPPVFQVMLFSKRSLSPPQIPPTCIPQLVHCCDPLLSAPQGMYSDLCANFSLQPPRLMTWKMSQPTNE